MNEYGNAAPVETLPVKNTGHATSLHPNGCPLSAAPLRVLVLNWWDPTHPRSGGAEVHLRQIFGRIARPVLSTDNAAQVTLLCCRYPGSPPEEQLEGMRVVRRGSPLLLHLLAPAWLYVHRAEFDVVVEYTNKLPFLTPLYTHLPRLCVAHHLHGEALRREFGSPLGGLFMAGERWLYRHVYARETFSAVSPSTAAELVTLGVAPERVHVIYNGADHSPPPAPPIFCENGGGVRGEEINGGGARGGLFYAGRLKRYKNLDCLLRAMYLLKDDQPQARLAIAGDGDDRSRLVALARCLELGERVLFLGALSPQEMEHWLSRAWVLVNPSVKEGWCISVMEAARYGTPAVGSDVPGLRDSIVDGQTGLLVPFGDAPRLAKALADLLRDPALRDRLGANARARSAAFRWETAAQQTLHLLYRLAERVT